jgi:hypothetical protein
VCIGSSEVPCMAAVWCGFVCTVQYMNENIPG